MILKSNIICPDAQLDLTTTRRYLQVRSLATVTFDSVRSERPTTCSTSTDNKGLPGIRQTCRNVGRIVIRFRHNASCGNRDNEGHAYRLRSRSAIERDVFRIAYKRVNDPKENAGCRQLAWPRFSETRYLARASALRASELLPELLRETISTW